jgi:cytochrome c-type biogenesis protein CcmE
VKPGSIKLESGSLKHSFILTDFIHEIKVYYDGILPGTMREGETSRVQGDFVNEFNPNELVAYFVESNHDAEVTKVSYQARSRDIEMKPRPMTS